MNIIITNSAGMPIYDQIASQIKAMILSGELKEGDPLPSMRALAQDLRVSVITTKSSSKATPGAAVLFPRRTPRC